MFASNEMFEIDEEDVITKRSFRNKLLIISCLSVNDICADHYAGQLKMVSMESTRSLLVTVLRLGKWTLFVLVALSYLLLDTEYDSQADDNHGYKVDHLCRNAQMP